MRETSPPSIERIEVSLIRQALSQSGGVVAHAARLLNTRRTTLVEKLRKYGLHREGVGDALQAGDGEGLHGEPRRAVASEA